MAETLDDLLDNLAHRQEAGQFVKQVDWDAVRERLVNDDEATRPRSKRRGAAIF